MKLKDFKRTKLVWVAAKKKGTHYFCSDCLDVNPDMSDGYSVCCNEVVVDWQVALKIAKRSDIQEFLDTKFNDVGSHSNNSSNSLIEYVLPTKNKKFSLNLNLKEDVLIDLVHTEIKGLRKDH